MALVERERAKTLRVEVPPPFSEENTESPDVRPWPDTDSECEGQTHWMDQWRSTRATSAASGDPPTPMGLLPGPIWSEPTSPTYHIHSWSVSEPSSPTWPTMICRWSIPNTQQPEKTTRDQERRPQLPGDGGELSKEDQIGEDQIEKFPDTDSECESPASPVWSSPFCERRHSDTSAMGLGRAIEAMRHGGAGTASEPLPSSPSTTNDKQIKRRAKAGRVGKTKTEVCDVTEEKEVTTLMIQNLPRRFGQQDLLRELDKAGFENKYDFFYLPRDFTSGWCKGYAFVNFISASAANSLKDLWHGCHSIGIGRRSRPLNVTIADIQGCRANAAMASSTKMGRIKNPSFKRLVLDRDGTESCASPQPTPQQKQSTPQQKQPLRQKQQKQQSTQRQPSAPQPQQTDSDKLQEPALAQPRLQPIGPLATDPRTPVLEWQATQAAAKGVAAANEATGDRPSCSTGSVNIFQVLGAAKPISAR
mmetsp:Transcript_10490/g.27786  ORF Transcript_10490/g.27786 Transcript_10490/m.27786 type:complete len:476 (-) Transcript_10490:180-1607(-)